MFWPRAGASELHPERALSGASEAIRIICCAIPILHLASVQRFTASIPRREACFVFVSQRTSKSPFMPHLVPFFSIGVVFSIGTSPYK